MNEICIVMVLYKMSLQDSPGFLSLFSLEKEVKAKLNVIIFENKTQDNSKDKILENHYTYPHFAVFEYYQHQGNSGLAKAYNYALHRAMHCGIKWLLLLDQDTVLTLEYIKKLILFAQHSYRYSNNIVAIVPLMTQDQSVFSPSIGLLKKPVQPKNDELISETGASITAINSGMLVSVAFLNLLGGFNLEFWLDGLDHWLFLQIRRYKKQVLVLNCIIRHDLSIASKGFVSYSRYLSILNAEKLLYLKYWNLKARLFYFLSLFKRLIQFTIKQNFWSYIPVTIKQFFVLKKK